MDSSIMDEDDEVLYPEEDLNTVESEMAQPELESEEEDVEPQKYSLTLDIGMDLEIEEPTPEEESGSLTPEERLSYLADVLMSGCVGKKEIKSYALDFLMSRAQPGLFRDENYILFYVLYAYRGKLRMINIDEEFLKLFLNRNRGLLNTSKSFIDINAYGEIDGSVELGYIGGVIKHFRRLVSMDDLTQIDFNTVYEKYLIEFESIEASKAYSQAQVILQEGLQLGRKKYFGYQDSSNYLKRRLAEIEGLVSQEKGSGFVTQREMLMEDKNTNKSYLVCDFDNLTKLNDIYGGIYSGMFYQVVAPPKAGKSKFCGRVVHTCAVKFHNNVTVWAQEGGKDAFSAQLRAIHFDYIYNTGVGLAERKYGVSQDAILHDKFPSDELKQLEASSKVDLACNQDYGSVDFIDRPFNVETFLVDIDTSVKSNSSSLVVIDYLQLIESANDLSERERVSKAYKTLLRYCNSNNVAVLSPGQFKQETFDKLMDGGTSGIDLRTAGGVSAEVVRTPDIIFALWATTDDLINNTMKIFSVPSRFSKAFPAIDVVTNMEVCDFVSVT